VGWNRFSNKLQEESFGDRMRRRSLFKLKTPAQAVGK
jgi:hypothetical protein